MSPSLTLLFNSSIMVAFNSTVWLTNTDTDVNAILVAIMDTLSVVLFVICSLFGLVYTASTSTSSILCGVYVHVAVPFSKMESCKLS